MKLVDTHVLLNAINADSREHAAALAIEHGATLVSFDRDFERFAGLSFELLEA